MCPTDSGEGLAFEGKAWVGLLTGPPPGPDTREPVPRAQHHRGMGAADCLTGLHRLCTQTDHRVLTWLGAPQGLCADLQGSRGVCPLWDGGWVGPDLVGGAAGTPRGS